MLISSFWGIHPHHLLLPISLTFTFFSHFFLFSKHFPLQFPSHLPLFSFYLSFLSSSAHTVLSLPFSFCFSFLLLQTSWSTTGTADHPSGSEHQTPVPHSSTYSTTSCQNSRGFECRLIQWKRPSKVFKLLAWNLQYSRISVIAVVLFFFVSFFLSFLSSLKIFSWMSGNLTQHLRYVKHTDYSPKRYLLNTKFLRYYDERNDPKALTDKILMLQVLTTSRTLAEVNGHSDAQNQGYLIHSTKMSVRPRFHPDVFRAVTRQCWELYGWNTQQH